MSRFALLVVLALLASGCSFHAFSPPTRLLTLESAETLKEGETSIGAEGSVGGFVFGDVSGLGGVRVRRGLADGVEVSIDAAAGYVAGWTFSCEDASSDCVPGHARGAGAALRVGAKWAPWIRHFALTGGIGGGGSLLGGFFGADLGVIASYDNPHFVPFVSTTLGVSLPFMAPTLHFGENRDAASTTMWWSTTLGVKLPLPIGPNLTSVRGSVLLGVGTLYLYDGTESDAAALATLGGEVSF